MVRVALYARVSTEDQAKGGLSLEAQLERMRAYCTVRGWQVVMEYVDDGFSGRYVRRPAYQRMILDRDSWDMILVARIDRVHRNSNNFAQMIDDLGLWGKEFASVQDSVDTSTAMGRFVVDIIQRIAQLESDMLAERVYMGMEHKARTGGGALGFRIPYGYDYKEGSLLLNPKEASVVTRIFANYIAGLGSKKIAKALNAEGIASKNGKKWGGAMVRYMLRNPLYCGYNRWGEFLRPGKHESIVSVADFMLVQTLYAQRRNSPPARRDPSTHDSLGVRS